MRWIFYALLAANGVLLVWYQVADYNRFDVNRESQTSMATKVAPIRLLAELIEEGGFDLEKKSVEQKCDVYGPFFVDADSKTFLLTVQKHDIAGRQEQEQVKLKPYYWAYVEPLDSKRNAQAVINRLRGFQLNAELIVDGRLKNGVGLGNFETKDDVERLQRQLLAHRIELQFIEKPRDYKQFWVVLDPGSETQLKGSLQEQLIADYPDIFHQQKVCKPVASR